MKCFVAKSFSSIKLLGHEPPYLVLIADNWDDWFQYETTFWLHLVLPNGVNRQLDRLKIGCEGQTVKSPAVPVEFDELPTNFFSLGFSENYYETLCKLQATHREDILTTLRDMAFNQSIYETFKDENVVRTSLARNFSQATVRGQLYRLAHGGARLTPYSFGYVLRQTAAQESPRLDFAVRPESNPPTNLHVLVGRNGAGKTSILDAMMRSLVGVDAHGNQEASPVVGTFDPPDINLGGAFSALGFISLSVFDKGQDDPRSDNHNDKRLFHIGLVPERDLIPSEAKSAITESVATPLQASDRFVGFLKACVARDRIKKWREFLEALETDGVFKQAGFRSLPVADGAPEVLVDAKNRFDRLSSGHKSVLLCVTGLLANLEEKTLVLVDEPEMHLHPPLVSAFVRTVSSALIYYNSVAIVATHSPVVLQEVPRSCVWRIRRSGNQVKFERPTLETYGENVGTLTREIFGLEVIKSGFHKSLVESVASGKTYEVIIENYEDQLGQEARAILSALVMLRDKGQIPSA